MNGIKIQPFSNYVLRTPAYPIKYYLDLLNKCSFSEVLNNIKEDDYFKESIRIASPDLLNLIESCIENQNILSFEKEKKLRFTLLKYISRISNRCTPFGLFAGCSIGFFNNENNIIIDDKVNFSRFTQFDMSYLGTLIQHISNRNDIQKSLVYRINTSLYPIDNFFRYIEYKNNGAKRDYFISAIRKNQELINLFEIAKKGVTFSELVNAIVDNESEIDLATEFINNLIQNQILVSNLDPVITGTIEIARLLDLIAKIPQLQNEKVIISKLINQLNKLDENIIPNKQTYIDIIHNLNKLMVPFDEKYLFQTDMNTKSIVNTLNEKISNSVTQTLIFLSHIKRNYQSENLVQFINDFSLRYETREMPLTTVLDSELGIGYSKKYNSNDSNPIIDKFSFESITDLKNSEQWSNIDRILEKILQNAFNQNSKEINLSEKDFPNHSSNFEKCTATFSAMIELVNINGQEKIILGSAGGKSAAKLLARFSNFNGEILELTKEIIEKEKEFYDDVILAEIVHIPESRTGNILKRPILREYEIPYLSNSIVDISKQIEITDLMISLKNNEIILRSIKNNKRVIPCLSNSHFYEKKSLPIYHFLCDLQSEGINPILSFSWGILENHYSYFPRVNYNNVIISKEKWIFKKEDFSHFYTLNRSELYETFFKWKKEFSIPKYVTWSYYDNFLLFDFEKKVCVDLFLNAIKEYSSITLEEFLFTDECIVKNVYGEEFTNQIIMSFYKERSFND